MDSILYQSATTLAHAIRNKELSSYDLVTAAIARIEQVNPQLNAVVQERFEDALADARRADEQLLRGEPCGPLHGLPMTIKDSFDTAGVISTAGTKGRATYVPMKDATVVARLREAGAILLGKTNTSEITAVGITDNTVYGRTNNPYNLACTPAGSSGGAAAIVAAGGVPFDIGSDTGGSVRMPAHYCGIAGIKPTMGRVPRTGHIMSFDTGLFDMLSHVGPFARYVEDLNLLLPILSGVDYQDPSVIPFPLGSPADVTLPQLRVAYHLGNGYVTPDADTARTFDQALSSLSAVGMTLVEDRPAALAQAEALFYGLVLADGGDAIGRILRQSGTDPADIHASIRWTQEGQPVSTLELTALQRDCNIYRSQMLGFLQDYDAIVCPASATPAPRHEAADARDFTYMAAYNLTGWPAAVVRAGTSGSDLPIGVQIIARPWRDDVALAIAQHIETAFGGWQPSVL